MRDPLLYNERELLSRLSRGDEAAFTEIYNIYWDKLFVVATHKLYNPSEAEELVQDIFLDVWHRREELQINSLSAYLATAVKYRVINALAKRNRQLRYEQHAGQTTTEADLSTEQWLSFGDLRDKLGKLVADLPEKCRIVFQLSRDKGFSQKEIAHELGIAEKTVEAHLSKAIRTLRTHLAKLIMLLF